MISFCCVKRRHINHQRYAIFPKKYTKLDTYNILTVLPGDGSSYVQMAAQIDRKIKFSPTHAHPCSLECSPGRSILMAGKGHNGSGCHRQCRGWIQPEQKGLTNALWMQILETSQGMGWAALASCPTSSAELGDCAQRTGEGRGEGEREAGRCEGLKHPQQRPGASAPPPGPQHQSMDLLHCPMHCWPLSGPRWIAHGSCTSPHRCHCLLPNHTRQSWGGESGLLVTVLQQHLAQPCPQQLHLLHLPWWRCPWVSGPTRPHTCWLPTAPPVSPVPAERVEQGQHFRPGLPALGSCAATLSGIGEPGPRWPGALEEPCTAREEDIQGLYELIIDFYNFMAPCPEEAAMRRELVTQIKTVVKTSGPQLTCRYLGALVQASIFQQVTGGPQLP